LQGEYALKENNENPPDPQPVAAAALLDIDPDRHLAMVTAYFAAAEELSNGLLHAIAAAQVFAGRAASTPNPQLVATAARYRGTWRDEYAYIGLRVLAYHPGPTRLEGGRRVLTTGRHTDATWLTLLWNDEIAGLEIGTPQLGDIQLTPPAQGALLVNTGNVMAKASESFFNSVCHWVKRTAATETETRVSMPFFYDRRNDPKPGPGFWAGGTGGC
jgi:hypothetical protein